MKKKAWEVKKGDKIKISGQRCLVEEVELSEIGKHGKRKVRISIITSNKEKIVIIRPEDYPIDSE